jgi:serine/threonine-protein kinase
VTQAALSNRYRLDAKIAKGGMGVVHRAYDDVLGRPVAVKLLAGDLGENPEFIERFRREARNAAMLLHPNIAGIFDYGHDGDRWYMVMELVEGEDLAARLKRDGRLHWTEAFALAEHVAAALTHAHARGLVHRDVKPGNILICTDDTAKVTDFGIALAVQATTTLTQTGTALGTPNYMAPEQAKGEQVGPAADLYAVGVVLFECVTGERPYQADSGIALAMQHVTAPVPDPRERGIDLPDEVADVVVRCMAKRPGDRYPSAAALREALRSCQPALATVPTEVFARREAARAAAAAGAGGAGATAAEPPATTPSTVPPLLVAAPSASPDLAEWTAAPAWPAPAPDSPRPGSPSHGRPPADASPEGVGASPPGSPGGLGGRPGGGSLRMAAVVVAAALLVIAAFLVGRTMGDGGGRRGTGAGTDRPELSLDGGGVLVPTGVVGSDLEVARGVLTRLGLTVNVRWEDAAQPKGSVMRVSPGEGTSSRKDGTVTLMISNGPG